MRDAGEPNSAGVIREGTAAVVAPGTGGGRQLILIVDDSLTVRMDLCQTFACTEYEVRLCESLSEARAALAVQTPALVILDVLLPDGDGVDLLREIKSRLADLPVMLLSSEAEVADRLRGLKTGADDYVGKPYDPRYVLARARELAGAGRCAAASPPQRLLLVDDSATSRHQFTSILQAAGYTVVTAESGEEGLQTAFAIRPAAIIVDRVLPGGIDGDTVIRRVKQDVRLRHTPCLLLTGSGGEGEELRMLEAGADAFLRKEVAEDVFLARLSALLRSGDPAPAAGELAVSSLLGSKKILAVDDSLTYLTELADELRKEGYDVVPAGSGQEALELLEVQPVDCILLDVRMPGLSGYETCRIIKQRPAVRGVPLLMLTAAEGPEAVVEGINSGADDFICKSADFTVLKARLRAQLRKKQFEDENRLIREELQRKQLEAAEARAGEAVAQARADLVEGLEKKNRELEAFASAVAHDLRAPVRTIRGFSQAVLDDFAGQFPEGAAAHLQRVQTAALRMSNLIDALLELSRNSTAPLRRQPVDFSSLARSVACELAESSHGRPVECSVQDGMTGEADARLMRVVYQNLLGNAWKFSGKQAHPKIEAGVLQRKGQAVYFVRDNGAGFDSARAAGLFQPFERLHAATEFPGAGIGLATVRRIVLRHGGEIWAESRVGEGAIFLFTIGPPLSQVKVSEHSATAARRARPPGAIAVRTDRASPGAAQAAAPRARQEGASDEAESTR